MKFKTDENLPTEAAGLLRAAGYDAVTIGDERLGGSADETVGAACRREGRVLLTLDLDSPTSRPIRPTAIPDSMCSGWSGRTRPASSKLSAAPFHC